MTDSQARQGALPQGQAAQPYATQALPPQPAFVVLLDATGAVERVLPLTTAGLSAGRVPTSDLELAAPTVSRNHLRVDWDGQRALVTDLDSRGGTRVGEERLAANSARVWAVDEPLRVGPYTLRLHFGPPPAVGTPYIPQAPAAPMPAGTTVPLPAATSIADAPTVRMAPANVALNVASDTSITPGYPTTIDVLLTNRGQVPVAVVIEVDGASLDWIDSMPRLTLPPSGQGIAPLVVNVPETPASAAGVYAVVVRARAVDSGLVLGEAAARWNVQPFEAAELGVTPRRATGRSTAGYTVSLQNTGNVPAEYLLSADGDSELTWTLANERLSVAPGATATTTIAVHAPSRVIGGERRYELDVRATSAGEAREERVVFAQRALMPVWAPLLMLPLLALLFTGPLTAAFQTSTPTPRNPQAIAVADQATSEALNAQATGTVVQSTVQAAQLALTAGTAAERETAQAALNAALAQQAANDQAATADAAAAATQFAAVGATDAVVLAQQQTAGAIADATRLSGDVNAQRTATEAARISTLTATIGVRRTATAQTATAAAQGTIAAALTRTAGVVVGTVDPGGTLPPTTATLEPSAQTSTAIAGSTQTTTALTRTATNTATRTATSTATVPGAASPQPTTPTQTPTDQPTQTPTNTPSQTPTQTPTDQPTQTPTDQPTQTPTDTPTQTPTDTPLRVVGITPIDDPVNNRVDRVDVVFSANVLPDVFKCSAANTCQTRLKINNDNTLDQAVQSHACVEKQCSFVFKANITDALGDYRFTILIRALPPGTGTTLRNEHSVCWTQAANTAHQITSCPP
jgi:hypothetical protein